MMIVPAKEHRLQNDLVVPEPGASSIQFEMDLNFKWASTEQNCARRIFAMSLEMTKADLHREVNEKALKLFQKKTRAPFYAKYIAHIGALQDRIERSRGREERCYWVKLMYRYTTQQIGRLRLREAKRYIRFYETFVFKAFEIAEQGMDADLMLYYTLCLPRDLPLPP